MVHGMRRLALIVIVSATTLALSGCLISNMSGGTVGGLTTVQATVTLLNPSPCVVDVAAVTTTCSPVIQVAPPGAGTLSFPFVIKLLGYASPLTLYDPLIVQVPASMSSFAGSIAVGPPGVAPDTPLSIISGLTSVPIDASTNLVAEPGMQLVIIDFLVPSGAPVGTYTLKLQFAGTTSSIKVMFAGKIAKGAQTYYVPIYPCVTNFADVPAIALPVTNPAALIASLVSVPGCTGKVYDFSGLAAGVELNQHGLTGSWYEPATDGQGFEVEVFPGLGSIQVSWFTYDAARRRSEAAALVHDERLVVTGQPCVAPHLSEYRRQFQCPTDHELQFVGTATLSFDTCATAPSYTFTDGSGRTGRIPHATDEERDVRPRRARDLSMRTSPSPAIGTTRRPRVRASSSRSTRQRLGLPALVHVRTRRRGRGCGRATLVYGIGKLYCGFPLDHAGYLRNHRRGVRCARCPHRRPSRLARLRSRSRAAPRRHLTTASPVEAAPAVPGPSR